MGDLAINGDSAIALAWKQIDPDVCAAYPITPQTIIVEKFSDYVANGEVGTEFVCVESEHSALTVCTSSCSAGARTFTATSSQGLAYMWEMLPITSAMRVPLVMAVANRAISGPINIHNDHGDVMSARDTGWLQIFAENVQEAYDNAIMAPRIAEHPDIQLPIMTNLDGFILTHAIERSSTTSSILSTLSEGDTSSFPRSSRSTSGCPSATYPAPAESMTTTLTTSYSRSSM